MKYVLPNKLIEIANNVAQIPGMKTILKPFYYPYTRYLKNKRNKHFQEYGLEVLKKFSDVLTSNNYEYTLAFGTLLGAVREKNFIKHDLDIDVAMWAEDWTPDFQKCLQNAGFKLWHSYEIDEGKLGREETYVYNDVSIDIFYFYPPIDKYPYCCDFLTRGNTKSRPQCMKLYGSCLPRRIEMPMTKERILTEFADIQLFIPANAHEILAFRYGDDYMIPNPQWNIKSYDNHIIEWEDKKGIYKEFN